MRTDKLPTFVYRNFGKIEHIEGNRCCTVSASQTVSTSASNHLINACSTAFMKLQISLPPKEPSAGEG
eukprot:8267797-Pyramimonas_sp.AAC.2